MSLDDFKSDDSKTENDSIDGERETPNEFKDKHSKTHNIVNVEKSGPGLRVTVSCKNCGKEESVTASRIRDGKKKFCSISCQRIYQGNKDIELNNRKILSYIGGVYVGDGHIGRYNGENVFRLNTVDKKFRDKVSDKLEEIGCNTYCSTQEGKGNEQKIFFVRVRSKPLVDYIDNNFSKEDRHVNEEYNNSKKEIKKFICGFFESEGSSSAENYDIRMSQKNKEILISIKNMLEELNFEASIYDYSNVNGNPIHILKILGGRNERARFYKEINPVIKNRDEGMVWE